MSGSTQEPREAWGEVGRRFEELGRVLREHFSGTMGPTPDSATWTAATDEPGLGESGTAASDRPGTAASDRPGSGYGDRAAMRDALQRLGQAAQRLSDQAGEAVRDPAVRETAQQAARTFADALAATVSELSEELRSRVGPPRGSEQARQDPAGPDPARQPPPPELGGSDGRSPGSGDPS
ncbi:MAG TPA: hypothetical protein VEL73_01180 [Mycobacteriales bacterium]|nr:hypothetical protein [Mycobacteriales bacterium]